MTLDVANKLHAGRVVGKTILYIGQECLHWSIDDFVSVAKLARRVGFDTICPKRGEGTWIWAGSIAALQEEAKAVRAVGCGYIPLWYCDGPKFGLGFVPKECDMLIAVQESMAALNADGVGYVVADMEIEWNGQLEAAKIFTEKMAPGKHLLYISTWADPQEQNWVALVNILRGCMNVYSPQAYNNWLDSAAYREIAQDICIQTAVDLSYEFGSANDPGQIAQCAAAHGQTSVWVWEYTWFGSYRQNAQAVIQAMKSVTIPAEIPAVSAPASTTAAPPQQKVETYTIAEHDTVSEKIYPYARSVGYTESYEAFLAAILPQLDAAARERGLPNSNGGNELWAGTTVTFTVQGA